jgi:hypothetical protein
MLGAIQNVIYECEKGAREVLEGTNIPSVTGTYVEI